MRGKQVAELAEELAGDQIEGADRPLLPIVGALRVTDLGPDVHVVLTRQRSVGVLQELHEARVVVVVVSRGGQCVQGCWEGDTDASCVAQQLLCADILHLGNGLGGDQHGLDQWIEAVGVAGGAVDHLDQLGRHHAAGNFTQPVEQCLQREVSFGVVEIFVPSRSGWPPAPALRFTAVTPK